MQKYEHCRKCWKGRPKKRWNEEVVVVKDDLKKCGLDRGLAISERQGEMKGSSYGENVRPVRARTRDVKREESVILYYCS